MGVFTKLKKTFQGEPSLEELQRRQEIKTVELDIKQKEVLIKELEARGRKWEQFSVDGTKKGIDFSKIMAFIRGSKGSKK